MSNIEFTFILLNGMCFLTFLFWGRLLSRAKNEREYFRNGFVLILIYAIVHGLRFGRDIDWNLYYFRYKSIGENLNNEDYEPLFSLICYSLYNLGIPYHVFIFLQCAFLMFTILVLLRNNRKYAAFVFPLLLPLIHTNDCYIRWWFAISFIFLAIDSYINKKTVWAVVWFVCSILIHFGVIVFAPILFMASYINKIAVPPKLAILLIVISTFAISLSSFTFLVNISSQLLNYGLGGDNAKAETYLMSTQDLINGDFGRLGYYERSISNKIRFLISCVPAIWFMHKYIDNVKYGRFFYNVFVMGAFVKPVFLVEILDRYASALSFFSCIICGAYFFYVWNSRHTKSFVVLIITLMSLFASVWPGLSIAWSFERDLEMMYMWNCGNRTYLTH